eukprot:6029749-Heterocapsa_arctica.AAC.1
MPSNRCRYRPTCPPRLQPESHMVQALHHGPGSRGAPRCGSGAVTEGGRRGSCRGRGQARRGWERVARE